MGSCRRLPARAPSRALARLALSMEVGERSWLALPVSLSRERARALLTGAGFEVLTFPAAQRVRVRRLRTLPDWIRPGLNLLICGLNPSLYAADRGVPFARPGNRFWPAALRAGLVELDRDPFAALARGVGFTDCVKRATRRASELHPREYAAGLQRVAELVGRYRPQATCFVGLEGWRHAADRSAKPGWLAEPLGGRPAYLMPSTSGLNAHATLGTLTQHLRRAARGC